jgi:hypothetical protein
MDDEQGDPIGRGSAKASEVRGRRCTAISRSTGERCARAPIVGGFVCSMHGGRAPQVRESARKRLLALVDPAIDGLLRAMEARGTCSKCGRSDDMSVVVRAAQVVLDRTGHGPSSTLLVGRSRYEEELDRMGPAELAEEAERMAGLLRAAAEEDARGAADGEAGGRE